MPNSSENSTTRLVDARSIPRIVVPAVVSRSFKPEELAMVEATWSGARQRLAEARAMTGEGVEHAHWDWRNKFDSVVAGRHRLVAITYAGDFQGLMAVATLPRQSLIDPGELILYVDYIEAAPWNVHGYPDGVRFLGVGTALMQEAIWLSSEAGYFGKLGLHSLPQAEAFYEQTCRMTRLGKDEGYYDLTYFEYTSIQATEWVASVGGL